ncbi:MAG: CHAP domain-containing protein [Acidimicrobiales bacterium]
MLFLLVACLGGVAVALSSGGTAAPSTPVRTKMVSLAEGQVGYVTSPSDSYCNTFSAFWGAGTTTCGAGLRSEEWCADFAAWVWYEAGARMTYALSSGDINAAAASFYVWAVDHGTWHAAASSYTPRPGDVAVYGLDTTSDVASHVAVVTGDTLGDRGPNVVNGDGDRTGFSVVETGTDQFHADVPGRAGVLSGYASPIIPRRTGSSSGG